MKKLLKIITGVLSIAVLSILSPNTYVYADVADTSVPGQDNKTVGGFNYYLNSDGTIEVSGFNNNDDGIDLIIPDTIDGKPVTSIGASAFYVNDFASVSIPGSVTVIKENSFKYCNDLETVTFRNPGLIKIEKEAFIECKKLSSILLPDTVVSIGSSAFCNTPQLKTISLPANLTSLGKSAFADSGISKLYFGKKLTKLNENVFMGCENLTGVTIPSTVTTIGNCSFSNCSKLKSIIIPKSVTYIHGNAFYGTELKSIKCDKNTTDYRYATAHNIPVKSIPPYFSTSKLSLIIGDKETLKVSHSKSTSNWKSSNTKVVKVSKKGEITAIGKGKATISVTADGQNLSCQVTVSDLYLNSKKVSVTKGKKYTLKVNGSKTTPVWTSSDESIAVVSKKGVVTAVSTGSATITAKVSGRSYTCNVFVKANAAILPRKVQDRTFGEIVLCITKVAYSGKSMILDGYLVNNTAKEITGISDLKIEVKKGQELIAEQTFPSYDILVPVLGRKNCSFIINSNNVKETALDLRICGIHAKANGYYEFQN